MVRGWFWRRDHVPCISLIYPFQIKSFMRAVSYSPNKATVVPFSRVAFFSLFWPLCLLSHKVKSSVTLLLRYPELPEKKSYLKSLSYIYYKITMYLHIYVSFVSVLWSISWNTIDPFGSWYNSCVDTYFSIFFFRFKNFQTSFQWMTFNTVSQNSW